MIVMLRPISLPKRCATPLGLSACTLNDFSPWCAAVRCSGLREYLTEYAHRLETAERVIRWMLRVGTSIEERRR